MTKTEIKTAIELLKEAQNPKVDYARLVCAEPFTYGSHYVWEDPLDYAIETALNCMQTELDRQENKALTIEELILLLDENERYPIWYQYADCKPKPKIMTSIATNRHTGEHKVYFFGENFAIVSKYTKFYKYKPKEV